MVKRVTSTFRRGAVIDVMEYHDCGYGARGESRSRKSKPTPEDVRRVNRLNKMRRCRQKLLTYIDPGDLFLTLTYRVKDRPADMDAAKKDLTKLTRALRRAYGKRKTPCYWFANIEQGTKGAWHIHMVVNDIGDTARLAKESWTKGGVYMEQISLNDRLYDEDFTKLAAYMTKDEHDTYRKEDGTEGKPRIRQASYHTSRNMPLPEPKKEKLLRWREEPLVKRGYFVARIHEGKNPVTGFKYRRYTMFRLERKYKGNGFYPVSDRMPESGAHISAETEAGRKGRGRDAPRLERGEQCLKD